MFSARAYSFRQKSRLAISLSWVSGYTNVVLFMVCGTFVSHMTGNTTIFGKSLSDRATNGVMLFGGLWLSFLLGAAASALMTETARRRGSASKYVLPLAVEALLLTIVLVGISRYYRFEELTGPVRAIIACLSAASMGLQNATITKISGAVVRTTHMTGVTTDLGIEGVQYLLWFCDRLIPRPGWSRAARMIRISRRHPEFQRVALLGTILGSFLLGTVVGAAAFLKLPALALALPIIFLLWVIYVDWSAPIADVREIDLLGDQELRLHGIVKSLLPPELGIWRVFCKHKGQWHKAPDFEQWIEIMPRQWQVIILALSPLTRFDVNAMMNLAAATRKLHEQERRLVLAGVTPVQYRSIAESEAARVIDRDNLCPDLEFAIARGIDLVRARQEAARAGPA
jgi:uncharacterized membrane protein YoaK (UPF0700 family)/anti-anti-sigma regulatory factor